VLSPPSLLAPPSKEQHAGRRPLRGSADPPRLQEQLGLPDLSLRCALALWS